MAFVSQYMQHQYLQEFANLRGWNSEKKILNHNKAVNVKLGRNKLPTFILLFTFRGIVQPNKAHTELETWINSLERQHAHHRSNKGSRTFGSIHHLRKAKQRYAKQSEDCNVQNSHCKAQQLLKIDPHTVRCGCWWLCALVLPLLKQCRLSCMLNNFSLLLYKFVNLYCLKWVTRAAVFTEASRCSEFKVHLAFSFKFQHLSHLWHAEKPCDLEPLVHGCQWLSEAVYTQCRGL